MNNWTILYALTEAPDGQLDAYWEERCKDFNGSELDLMDLFEEIHNTTSLETSKFVRMLVDPMFTRRRVLKDVTVVKKLYPAQFKVKDILKINGRIYNITDIS